MITESQIRRQKQLILQCTDTEPYAAALCLGNLCKAYLQNHPDLANVLHESINEILSILSQLQINLLVRTVLDIPEARLRILPEQNFVGLNALKDLLPRLGDYFQKIDYSNLIQMASTSKQARWLMLCIIQKHLNQNAHYNPIAEHPNPLSLIEADPTQNNLEMNELIAKCSSLPVHFLNELGFRDQQFAENIIDDIGTHIDGYQICTHLALKHSQLAEKVFLVWQNRLSSLSFNPAHRRECLRCAERLSETYPIFHQLNPPPRRISRVVQNISQARGTSRPNEVGFYDRLLSIFGLIASGLSALGGGALSRHLAGMEYISHTPNIFVQNQWIRSLLQFGTHTVVPTPNIVAMISVGASILIYSRVFGPSPTLVNYHNLDARIRRRNNSLTNNTN